MMKTPSVIIQIVLVILICTVHFTTRTASFPTNEVDSLRKISTQLDVLTRGQHKIVSILENIRRESMQKDSHYASADTISPLLNDMVDTIRERKQRTLQEQKVTTTSIPPTASPSISCQTPIGIAYGSNTKLVNFTLSATDGAAENARLNNPSFWQTQNIGPNTYLQVELDSKVILTGALIQGNLHSWVTSFSINYSIDCQSYQPLQENGNTKIFAGGVNSNSTSAVIFNHVFVAKCIRIIPVERHGPQTSLQLELIGCGPTTCLDPVRMGRNVSANNSELNLHFDEEKIITMIEILPTSHGSSHFTIAYSRTCVNYNYITENGNIKVFSSPGGEEIMVDLRLEPLRGQCLKIKSSNIQRPDISGVDISLLGCDISANAGVLQNCGRTRYRGRLRKKRVIGGVHSVPGEWPWLASFHFLDYHAFSNRSGYPHLCGGTLIDPQWVLTAAHCFNEELGAGLSNINKWRVVLGEHNQAGLDGTEQIFRIEQVFRHNQFQIRENEPLLHDIALVKLAGRAVLSDYVNVVCLDEKNSFSAGTLCTVAGWGQNRVDGTGVRVPLHASIPIIQSSECDRRYSALPDDNEAKPYIAIVESVVCAAGEENGRDSCLGDSGGPLLCQEGDQWYQVGIVSFGYVCGNPNFPGIYTRISAFSDWIEQTIHNNTNTNSK